MELLKTFLRRELNITDEVIFDKFLMYNKLLLEWNSKINLISRNSKSIESQVLFSIFFLTKYSIPENARIADIGTGGGFPGIPLKIIRNDLKITLIDSICKKANAVANIVKDLDLNYTEVLSGRAEIVSKESSSRNKYDIVIAKSVAILDKLYKWTHNFPAKDGEMIFIKGGDIKEELDGLKKKNRNINVRVITYNFNPVYEIEDKKIVIIKKNK